MWGMCHGWWGPGYFFGGLPGMIFGFAFWILVISGIFYLISRPAKRAPEDTRQYETPVEILKKRYARGEIDAEEFARRRRDLES